MIKNIINNRFISHRFFCIKALILQHSKLAGASCRGDALKPVSPSCIVSQPHPSRGKFWVVIFFFACFINCVFSTSPCKKFLLILLVKPIFFLVSFWKPILVCLGSRALIFLGCLAIRIVCCYSYKCSVRLSQLFLDKVRVKISWSVCWDLVLIIRWRELLAVNFPPTISSAAVAKSLLWPKLKCGICVSPTSLHMTKYGMQRPDAMYAHAINDIEQCFPTANSFFGSRLQKD